jgi:RNA polymerase sigma-70 factor (ECF subfamily)
LAGCSERIWGIVDFPNDEQITAWYPRLFRTALRMTGSQDDAADVTQQAFCKALSRWHTFDSTCLPTTWLHGILVNCVRDRLRREARRPSAQTADPSVWAVDLGGGTASAQFEAKEQADRLGQAIAALPDGLRTAFVAAVLDGYTYQETAEMLSLPVGTVGHRIYRARRIVAKQMREWFPEAKR